MENETTYRLLIASSGVMAVAVGFLNPFLIVLLNKAGTFQQFGVLIGVSLIVAAVTSYFAGSLSDRVGRKPLMIAALTGLSVITFGYTLSTNFYYLVVLQVLLGVLEAVYTPAVSALLGDITHKKTRGRKVGLFKSIDGFVSGVFVIGGGFLAEYLSVASVFYIASLLFLLATVPLFRMRI